ncbi:hypothetical protein DSO57_1025141 [Entomophthora muscae]|uniref:Uncharacterized protein n=1 Tax=Entomophthora muscae TaxID=34485 RepID=A0ACC2RTF5_9FUNG|nr:hypothetical protein DSO57_1025141 [Entomophthora muscae]
MTSKVSMSSRVRQPTADRTPVLAKRPMPKGSSPTDSRSKFMRPTEQRPPAQVLKRPQEDEDFIKYGPKYKEAKLMLKSAQETYSGALFRLEDARRTIKRLKSRNSILLTELSNDSYLYEAKSVKKITTTKVSKAPVMDKDGFAIPLFPMNP